MAGKKHRDDTRRSETERLRHEAARELRRAERVRLDAEVDATRALAEAHADAAAIREAAYADAMRVRGRLLAEFGHFTSRMHEESGRVIDALGTQVDRLLAADAAREAPLPLPLPAAITPLAPVPPEPFAAVDDGPTRRAGVRNLHLAVPTTDDRPPVDLEGLFGPEPTVRTTRLDPPADEPRERARRWRLSA